MINLAQQKKVLLERLKYYSDTLPDRPDGYQQLKKRVSIPRIREALLLIERGEYGTCGGCGRNISEARLQAVPAALLCVCCQQKWEREAKRRI